MAVHEKTDTWYKSASIKEQKEFRSWLEGLLKTNEVDLTFTKKDGTIREMKCSLKESLLPVYEKKTDKVKTKSEESLSVFDLEKKEWRSFRFDSITSFKFDL
jgi:hypothetical protein